MQHTDATTDAALSAPSAAVAVAAPTPLSASLSVPSGVLTEVGGALSVSRVHELSEELDALIHGAGAYDLGYRSQIRVTGDDRMRWLNGMLTNNVQGLSEGEGSYNFVLNAQGRIQGDCEAYRLDQDLLLTSERSQIPALLAHFDRFIIMDDVLTEDLSATRTALGLTGPKSTSILESLGVRLPVAAGAPWVREVQIRDVPVQLTGGISPTVPTFEIWCANEHVSTLWDALTTAGATACGWSAVEALRVLTGVPRYGIDILDRDLPQETSQMRALHFSKGCYLGQEIVERIRSRGNVHRRLAVVTLSAGPSQMPLDLTAGEQTVGRITSVAPYQGKWYGLGLIRADAERHGILNFMGGTATLLQQPPLTRI